MREGQIELAFVLAVHVHGVVRVCIGAVNAEQSGTRGVSDRGSGVPIYAHTVQDKFYGSRETRWVGRA